MTSISVIAGNIPLALALEPGSSGRASLGIVVIGGITSSLILTLLLVPIMYVILAPKNFVPTRRDVADPTAHGGGNGQAGGNGVTPQPGAGQPVPTPDLSKRALRRVCGASELPAS